MILNPTKTKSLVVGRSRTANPPHGDLVLSGFSIRTSPNLYILNWCEVWQKTHLQSFEEIPLWYCFWYFSENCYFEVGEARLCRHLCVTSLLLCICSPNRWVLFSSVGSAAECHLQLLEGQVYSVAAHRPEQSFLSLFHRLNVALWCMLYKVN